MKTARRARRSRWAAMCLAGVLLAGSLSGCGAGEITSAVYGREFAGGEKRVSSSQEGMEPEIEQECTVFDQTAAEDTAYAIEDTQENVSERQMLAKQLACYEPFGMTYDTKRDVLTYNGRRVRYFEDYYSVGDEDEGAYGGIDFFDEKGVVDVCAVRDFSGIIRNADGSFDLSGKLTGLRRCSDEEFLARDVEALKNPPVVAATAAEGGEPSAGELREMAAEYAPFGVAYDENAAVWYYKGEKIRFFQDILMSNGKRQDGGDFSGAIRQFCQDGGTVDVYAERDFNIKNAQGYGTLTGVRRAR